MRIVVLSDNRKLDQSLESEHGLCIYIETEHYNCLLDTGASDSFIRNATKLNISLIDVDYVFISHGHIDHIGGLPAFLELNKKAKIVLSRHTINQKFFSTRNGFRQISLNFDFSIYSDRLVFVDTEAVFRDEIRVFSSKTNKYPSSKANENLLKDAGDGMKPDDFNHELVICFGTEDLVVYTGCAHNGLLNILNSISLSHTKKISYVLGGFHLLDSQMENKYENKNDIEQIAYILKNDYSQTTFVTGHCTGDQAFNQLKKQLNDQISFFYTGYSIII